MTIYIFPEKENLFRVQQRLLEEGSPSGLLSRLKKTIKRANTEPSARLLQIDVREEVVNAIVDEVVKETYKAGCLFPAALPVHGTLSSLGSAVLPAFN